MKAEEDFFSLLEGSPSDIAAAIPDDVALIPEEAREKRLFCISEENGNVLCTQVAEGDKCKLSLLKGDDVYLLDIGVHVFIWVGDKSSKKEKSTAMPLSINYLLHRGYLPHVPITRESDGLESQKFISSMAK